MRSGSDEVTSSPVSPGLGSSTVSWQVGFKVSSNQGLSDQGLFNQGPLSPSISCLVSFKFFGSWNLFSRVAQVY